MSWFSLTLNQDLLTCQQPTSLFHTTSNFSSQIDQVVLLQDLGHEFAWPSSPYNHLNMLQLDSVSCPVPKHSWAILAWFELNQSLGFYQDTTFLSFKPQVPPTSHPAFLSSQIYSYTQGLDEGTHPISVISDSVYLTSFLPSFQLLGLIFLHFLSFIKLLC